MENNTCELCGENDASKYVTNVGGNEDVASVQVLCDSCGFKKKKIDMCNRCVKCSAYMQDEGFRILKSCLLCRFCLPDDILKKYYSSVGGRYGGWDLARKQSRMNFKNAALCIMDYHILKEMITEKDRKRSCVLQKISERGREETKMNRTVSLAPFRYMQYKKEPSMDSSK